MLKIITKTNGGKYTIRENRNRIFYPREWLKFYNALKDSQEMTFDFLMQTGARINEAIHVKVEDIEFDNKRITLKVVKRRNYNSTGTIRIIPISTEFRNRLKKYIINKRLKNQDYLGLLSAPAAHIAMKKTLQKIGIKDWYMFSVHNIRKTFETWIVSQNVGVLKILKHMGHNSNTALRHYIQADLFTPEDKMLQKKILGDLYKGNGIVDDLYDKIKELELKILTLQDSIKHN